MKILESRKKLSSVFAGLLMLCVSWDDHPDKSHPTDSKYDKDYESSGWHAEKDHPNDRSDSAASHEGTCTGVPDRDR